MSLEPQIAPPELKLFFEKLLKLKSFVENEIEKMEKIKEFEKSAIYKNIYDKLDMLIKEKKE